jgi:hypothetical protein
VLAIPLLVASLKLAARDSSWWPVAITGVVLGGVAAATLAFALLYALAVGIGWLVGG